MGRLFGTDGVRGLAVSELTTEVAMLIGRAVAYSLGRDGKRCKKLLIGRDTRESCGILEAALAAGVCSCGTDAHILGIVPTPAVAALTVMYGADAGVMISASHNTFEFNGIKLFNSKGHRLTLSQEQEIERLVFDAQDQMLPRGVPQIGRVYTEKNAEWDYIRKLLKDSEANLDKLRIIIDAANGAAYSSAEKLFSCLGARVRLINASPDGRNINMHCGSTDVLALRQAVLETKAQAGIALDGDGDRCLMIDEAGNLLDGDRLLAILALHMKKRGRLSSNTCVVTPMTNLGFFPWARENGIVVTKTPDVGGGHVFERMVQDGYNLGGEQSGFIIQRDYSTTGDGLLLGAAVLDIMQSRKCLLSELAQVFRPYPQITVNVPLRAECRGIWKDVPDIIGIIEHCRSSLGDDGRIYVRESGTEPVLRIMAEGRNGEAVRGCAEAIARIAEKILGNTTR